MHLADVCVCAGNICFIFVASNPNASVKVTMENNDVKVLVFGAMVACGTCQSFNASHLLVRYSGADSIILCKNGISSFQKNSENL